MIIGSIIRSFSYLWRWWIRFGLMDNSRGSTVMTGFVRISPIYLITGFTLFAEQQFVLECVK